MWHAHRSRYLFQKILFYYILKPLPPPIPQFYLFLIFTSPIRALWNPSQILHNALHDFYFSFKSVPKDDDVCNLFESLENYVFRLTLLWWFLFWYMLFISFCFHSFVIFTFRLFLLISHCGTRTDEAWWVGRGEDREPGTHSPWSFWFMYQKTCKYASLQITSPSNDNLPQSALLFAQAGASLLSLPFEILVRSQACWAPIWFFHIFSFFPKHLFWAYRDSLNQFSGTDSSSVIPPCCTSL